VIEFTLPFPTPSLNRQFGEHWAQRAKERKKWGWLVRAERLKSVLDGSHVDHQVMSVMEKSRVTIERYGKRLLDRDNFIAGTKQLTDALVAEGFLVDDSPQHVQIEYRQFTGKPYRTVVRIEP